MSNLVFWLLIATVAIAPLPLGSNRPLPWSALSAIVAFLLILWGVERIVASLRRGTTYMMTASAATDGPRPPIPVAVVIDRFAIAFALAFGALIAWYCFQLSPLSAGLANPLWDEAARALGEPLSGAISVDPGVGGHQAMKLLAYGGVFFLAFALCRDRRRARWAYIALAVVGLAYAAYGLFALFAGFKTVIGLVPSSYSRSVTSTFINRNSYATYGGLCVILAMGPLLSELRQVIRSGASIITLLRTVSEEATPVFYLSALAIATGIMAVILTGSRAGVASLLLGLVVFGIGMLIVRDLSLRAFLVLMAIGTLCVTSTLILSGDLLTERIVDGVESDARWILFEIGRQVAGERPFVGYGLGGFAAAFNGGLRAPPGFDAYVDFAHNTYVELAVDGGIPALLLSLALVGMAVGICVTALFARARGTSFAITAIAGTVLVASHAMFDFSLQMPAVAVTFMLMLGVAAAQSLASERSKREATVGGSEATADKRRRRRRSSRGDRPVSADDSVTPPPEFNVPRTRPGAAPAGIARATVGSEPSGADREVAASSDPQGSLFAPSAKHWGDADGVAPRTHATVSEDKAAAAAGGTDSYRAALARWQALRQATAGPPPASAVSRDMPTSHDVWSAQDAVGSDDSAGTTSGDPPPLVDATVPQPPMPPAWPGEARRPGDAVPPPEDDPDNPSGNVVRLPRSRRP